MQIKESKLMPHYKDDSSEKGVRPVVYLVAIIFLLAVGVVVVSSKKQNPEEQSVAQNTTNEVAQAAPEVEQQQITNQTPKGAKPISFTTGRPVLGKPPVARATGEVQIQK